MRGMADETEPGVRVDEDGRRWKTVELPRRVFEPIVWTTHEGGGKHETRWPDDVHRCSECKALVLAADTRDHDNWHRKLGQGG